ncbi:beta-lactamase family protein [Streptacidiphilus sp. PB12-B1b]|uniref:serine hydrolase domain-containing protein n=1 Tax=Streptacidiphilus sp. PB12-B1b TaxID=2705012 RepID=UPI0015FD3C6F|nr:serine hydrolase domain-containing protein [Streptacidiphilus sp. PB12-B1b]QMU77287.1 beta-lactamase family protein [Streptacidiphilus sp. PB12-B1b]
MTRKRTALLCASALLLSSAPLLMGTASPADGTARRGPYCAPSPAPTGGRARAILDVIERDEHDLKLRAVVGRVTEHGRDVWTGAVGSSMTDVPARPDMRFRAGSVAIAFMGTILLQLVDEKRVHLDDRLSRWLPQVPHANEITLRMLADTTSGFHDYVTNPAFLKELEAHPFKHWTPREILSFADLHDLLYKPGTNFSYSHANFLLLGEALEHITHTRLDRLLEQRIYRPLGLHATSNSYTPAMPPPVLHAFTSERGRYEESTFWNPSWTTAAGAVINMNICDLARAGAGIGSGQTISRKGYQTLLDPGTIGLGTPTKKCPPNVCLPQTRAVHYGMSVLVVNGWIVQNPSFSGYAAIMAYLPSKDLSIALSVTYSPTTDQNSQNLGNSIAKDLSHLLVPNQPLA